MNKYAIIQSFGRDNAAGRLFLVDRFGIQQQNRKHVSHVFIWAVIADSSMIQLRRLSTCPI
jgi:hypothetical protein